MKKLLSIFIAGFMCFTFTTYADDATKALPLRDIFAGSSITWVDGVVPQVTIGTDVVTYVFSVGSDKFTANGRNYNLSEKVQLLGDTTYVPSELTALAGDIEDYQYGILDAIQADTDELFPLVALDPNIKTKATWKDGMVKVASWHRYPDTYTVGSEIDTSFGDVWVFTEDEIKSWAKGEDSITSRRFEQLIGLAPQSGYTHFSVMYVHPEDLFRPSADPEITDSVAQINFAPNVDTAHKNWYNSNIVYSYSVKYPWTRLGYTYDWNTDSDEYGLSEFIIRQGSKVKVENTFTTAEFVSYLKN